MVRLFSFALAFVVGWLVVWLIGLVLPLSDTVEYMMFGFVGVACYHGFKALFRQRANVS